MRGTKVGDNNTWHCEFCRPFHISYAYVRAPSVCIVLNGDPERRARRADGSAKFRETE